MICPECETEKEIKEFRQCQQNTECRDILCARCMELHKMDHRQNDDEREATKHLDKMWAYSHMMLYRMPAVMILMLLVTGAYVSIDLGSDGENIIDFTLPVVGNIAAIMAVMIIIPSSAIRWVLTRFAGFIKPMIPKDLIKLTKHSNKD